MKQAYETVQKELDGLSQLQNTQQYMATQMYQEAKNQLGFTDEQIAENKFYSTLVLDKMLSDDIAGNKKFNKALDIASMDAKDAKKKYGSDPHFAQLQRLAKMYNGQDNNRDKTKAHELVLDFDAGELRQYIDMGRADMTFSGFYQSLMRGHMGSKEEAIDAAIRPYLSADLSERIGQMSDIVKESGQAANLNANILDFADIKDLAYKALQGELSTASLEKRVGVEALPRYKAA